MKTCCECHRELESKEFNHSSSTKDGRQNWCRECQKTKYNEYRQRKPEKANARFKRYYSRNRNAMIARTRKYEESIGKQEYVRRYKLYNKNSKFTRYGITEAEYNQFLQEQKQKCGMCQKLLNKEKPRSIHIDHSHATGKVRGILCDGCNLFLGRFESEKYRQRVEQAQTYLRKTENAKDKEP